MLAAMTTIVLLASSATKAPPFNGLFYATVATVIPVLFLAVAVQGKESTYESLMRGATEGFSRLNLQRLQRMPGSTRRPQVLAAVSMIGATVLAVAILSAGVVGEVTVVSALYYRRAAHGPWYVLAEVVFLAYAAGAAPAAALGKFIFAVWRPLLPPRRSELRRGASGEIASAGPPANQAGVNPEESAPS
jgi:hypothetical protein